MSIQEAVHNIPPVVHIPEEVLNIAMKLLPQNNGYVIVKAKTELRDIRDYINKVLNECDKK